MNADKQAKQALKEAEKAAKRNQEAAAKLVKVAAEQQKQANKQVAKTVKAVAEQQKQAAKQAAKNTKSIKNDPVLAQTVSGLMPAVANVNGATVSALPIVGNQTGYGTGTVTPEVLDPMPVNLFDTGFPDPTSTLSTLGPASSPLFGESFGEGTISDYPDAASAQAALGNKPAGSNNLIWLIAAGAALFWMTQSR